MSKAYKKLTSHYLDSVGVIEPVKIARLFRWEIDPVRQALKELEQDGLASPIEDGRWASAKL